MKRLETAIEIAVSAHRGQEYDPGVPYVLHPIRVMLRMRTDEERIVALLHDVVEHTDWTFKKLRKKGFRGRILKAVGHLTKRPGEAYEAYIERLRPHPLARAVKLADLGDNLEQCRYPKPSAEDRRRIAKYVAALARLKKPRPRIDSR